MRRKRSGPRRSLDDAQLPKYSIAVASSLSGVPQQQLRRMEEGGLLAPNRTEGNTRRYSDEDLTQIGKVAELADEGINAAGIRTVLALRAEVELLCTEVETLRAENARLREQLARQQPSH